MRFRNEKKYLNTLQNIDERAVYLLQISFIGWKSVLSVTELDHVTVSQILTGSTTELNI